MPNLLLRCSFADKQSDRRLLYEPTFPTTKATSSSPIERHQAEAGRQGYNVLLFTGVQAQNENKIYRNSMNSLFLADGSIILGARPDRDELLRLIEEDYPFVYIGRREVSGFETSWVVSDYVATSAEAVHHLLELHHERFGFLTDTLDRESEQDKLTGARQGLGAVGDDLVVLSDVLDLPSESLSQQIQDGLTALLCANSDVFEYVMQALHRASIAVPGDVSVVCLIDATRPSFHADPHSRTDQTPAHRPDCPSDAH